MICHDAIATDRPRIQQITGDAGEGPRPGVAARVRVPAQAHVRFNHAPHIRANVECATCHGDIAKQTVAAAQRRPDHGLLRELSQREEGSDDCLTCHY